MKSDHQMKSFDRRGIGGRSESVQTPCQPETSPAKVCMPVRVWGRLAGVWVRTCGISRVVREVCRNPFPKPVALRLAWTGFKVRTSDRDDTR